MDTGVIVAIISLISNVIAIIAGSKLMAYRIEQLEKKVEKHNQVVERTYRLEGRVEYIEREISEVIAHT